MGKELFVPDADAARGQLRRAAGGAAHRERHEDRPGREGVHVGRQDVQEARLHLPGPADRVDPRHDDPVRARDPADAHRDHQAADARGRRRERRRQRDDAANAHEAREGRAARDALHGRRARRCSRWCRRAILGKIVKPALDALLGYFSLAVKYLQFVEGASSGSCSSTLFGVILFLVLNLATLILSMSFFLGKSQKIFQARFNDGTPIATHKRFFKWGDPVGAVRPGVPARCSCWSRSSRSTRSTRALLAGIKDAERCRGRRSCSRARCSWSSRSRCCSGRARGFKAIGFLASYKVKRKKRSDPARRSYGAWEDSVTCVFVRCS